MSSSTYSQGFQSCLEPSRMAEPRVLRLKLAPPKSNSPARSSSPPPPEPRFITNQEEDKNPKGNTIGMGGWSFLQCLSYQSQSLSHPPYTPPSMRHSSSFLCEKSLEMCTESLGSETGSGVGEKGGGGKVEVAALRSLENVEYNSTNYEKNDQGINIGSRLAGNRRRYKRIDSFPPPLTSISGCSGVQVKPYREGGRLVLKAVSVSSSQGYFHAERNNGRLTLHLVKDCSVSHNEHNEEEVEEEEEEEKKEEEEEEEEEGYNWEELEGISGKGGEEMGIAGKLASRPVSRCKESESGSKGLLNWGKTFWVAT